MRSELLPPHGLAKINSTYVDEGGLSESRFASNHNRKSCASLCYYLMALVGLCLKLADILKLF
jgi:hypothetical protein